MEQTDITLPHSEPEQIMPSSEGSSGLVLNELSIQTNSGNVGEVIRKVRLQLEKGIGLDLNGIEVKEGSEYAVQDLVEIDPASINRPEDIDAFSLAQLQKTEGERIKLMKNKDGKLVVLSEKVIGENRLTVIYDASFPNNKSYAEYLERRKTGRLTAEESILGYRGYHEKEEHTLARKLLITDQKTNKTFDLTDYIPLDWQLRYFLPPGDNYLSEDSSVKTITFGKIVSEGDLIKLFHEYGHAIFSANDDPVLANQASKLLLEAKFNLGGLRDLPPEKKEKVVELLARNERGASARALELVRILREKGVNLKIKISDQIKLLETGLDSYRKGLGINKKEFKSSY